MVGLLESAGLVASRGEGRRLATGGGIRVNDIAVSDGERRLTTDDCHPNGLIKLAVGKKKIVLIKPV